MIAGDIVTVRSVVDAAQMVARFSAGSTGEMSFLGTAFLSAKSGILPVLVHAGARGLDIDDVLHQRSSLFAMAAFVQ